MIFFFSYSPQSSTVCQLPGASTGGTSSPTVPTAPHPGRAPRCVFSYRAVIFHLLSLGYLKDASFLLKIFVIPPHTSAKFEVSALDLLRDKVLNTVGNMGRCGLDWIQTRSLRLCLSHNRRTSLIPGGQDALEERWR